jgi:hypothetical protein
MKHISFAFISFLAIALILCCGCTMTAPQQPSTGPQNPGTSAGASAAITAAPGAAAQTTVSSGRTIIDEKINILSGYQDRYKKYAFEDYGYEYLYPGDTFRISIDSDKPVNVLIIDKADEIKFPAIEPEWNTALKKDQWDYVGIVPIQSQSNVLRKEMTATIKNKSKYFLIIDPRFSSDQAGWRGSAHDQVNVDVKVTKF